MASTIILFMLFALTTFSGFRTLLDATNILHQILGLITLLIASNLLIGAFILNSLRN